VNTATRFRHGGARIVPLLLLALGLTSCAHNQKPVTLAVRKPAPVHLAPVPAPESGLVSDAHGIGVAQRALNALGFAVGRPDGVAGPATRRAIIAFQKSKGLTDDGRLTTALLEKLKALQGEQPKESSISVQPGDTLIYSDGAVLIVATERTIHPQRGNGAILVAIRPSTKGWPTEARVGLDWAMTHALDESASDQPVLWSSTGVTGRFEIRAYPLLSLRDAKLGDDAAQSCRRFEVRTDQPLRRYPGIACRDAKGAWYIPHSNVRLASPALELEPQTLSGLPPSSHN
jgi:peptidoglycan hydrolase-like protein with peptidoglycan-binding domain